VNALIEQFKALRLHGMAQSAQELLATRTHANGTPANLTTILKLLIEAETVERRVRSIQHQMKTAKFPHHKDFATFDETASPVQKAELEQLSTGTFTDEAHNLILVGGAGTGKTHISIALGTTLIQQGKKVRFHNAVDLINALIREQADGNAGRITKQLSQMDCVIIPSQRCKHRLPGKGRVRLHPISKVR
jgi:DNA replication protein DnaC